MVQRAYKIFFFDLRNVATISAIKGVMAFSGDVCFQEHFALVSGASFSRL